MWFSKVHRTRVVDMKTVSLLNFLTLGISLVIGVMRYVLHDIAYRFIEGKFAILRLIELIFIFYILNQI